MPTPVGHILSGTLLFSVLRKQNQSFLLLTGLMFYAMLPDIDLLFGFLEGNPNKYHHHFTHSFVFVITTGWVGAIFFKRNRMQFRIYAVLFIGAGVIHLLLDLLALDKSSPYGAPVFWPFSEKYFISPIQIFSDVKRSSDSQTFFKSLINWHNALTVFIEILILGPVILILQKSKKSNGK
jgi:membrane-bound metal-dependent hydrolase YbcI (DUF457 family)